MKYITVFALGLLAVSGFVFAKEYEATRTYTSGDTAVYNNTVYQRTSTTSGTSEDPITDGLIIMRNTDSTGSATRTNVKNDDDNQDALTDGLMIVRNKEDEKDSDTDDNVDESATSSEKKRGNVDANWKVEEGEKSPGVEPDEIDDKSHDEGEEHKSAVAAFVAELHRIASSTPRGIGEQVRVVARQVNDDNKDVSDKIDKVEKRGGIARFFIGTDKDSLDFLTEAASSTQTHIDELNQIKLTATLDVQQRLEKEIEVLNKEKARIEKVIDRNKGGFSLFGWLVNLF